MRLPGEAIATAEQIEFIKALLAKRGAQSEISWREYVARFGPITYNTYAHIARKIAQGAMGVVEKAPIPMPEPPTIQSISKAEQDRMRADAERKLLREVKAHVALEDALVAAFLKVDRVVPRIEVPRLLAPDTSSKPQTAILLLSDLHIGNKVDIEETGGLGEYNFSIFERRLDRLQYAIRSIVAHHRQSHPVNHLVCAMLGDMIENIDIFASQLELVDLDLMDQVIKCVERLKAFLIGLLDTFETIFVPVVTGNHGRIGRKGQHKRHINWDFVVGHWLKMGLERYADRITFEIPKAAFAVIDIEGYKWLLRHGDGIKSWGGIPFYGINRSTGRWIAIQASQGQFFDYMCMGHFHTPTTLTYTGGEVLINGCFPGPTEFSVEVIETLNRPMQFFGMVHPKYGLAARYPILLDPQSAR